MRRSDREITDMNEILEVIDRCDVCRLGLNTDGTPYIVPLNFASEYVDGTLRLYFHSAMEGRKLDLIRKDGCAAFEMDCGHTLRYNAEKQMCTMAYECVMGSGSIRFLEGEEKKQALDRIMLKYYTEGGKLYNPAVLEHTSAFCLTADEFTCKRRK